MSSPGCKPSSQPTPGWRVCARRPSRSAQAVAPRRPCEDGTRGSRKARVPLHLAFDQIANQEGFGAWSLLSAKINSEKPASTLLAQLRSSELVLLGSRPGQGKTRLGLEVTIHSMRQGNRAAFFTLYCTRSEIGR